MPFKFQTIDHIQLAAPKGSEDIARKFFQDTLGLDEVEKPESLKKRGGLWFQFGNHQIHIGIEEPFYPAKKAHPAFAIENLEALKQHLLTNGIDVKNDDRIPGVKRFFISDPFGNRMEFLERNTH
ncbi:VOC family protein [Peribacillus sp. NPDC097675]|uniref:VOC family protein n=1 Tax=Peribacillus sp. NPDC097675 TaxID=3390618 RepID=UPI003D062E63